MPTTILRKTWLSFNGYPLQAAAFWPQQNDQQVLFSIYLNMQDYAADITYEPNKAYLSQSGQLCTLKQGLWLWAVFMCPYILKINVIAHSFSGVHEAQN